MNTLSKQEENNMQTCYLLLWVLKTGESNLNIIAIQSSVHLPFDHRYLVQNLSFQVIVGLPKKIYYLCFLKVD